MRKSKMKIVMCIAIFLILISVGFVHMNTNFLYLKNLNEDISISNMKKRTIEDIGGEISWYDGFEGSHTHNSPVTTDPPSYWQDGGGDIPFWFGQGYTNSQTTGCGISTDTSTVDGSWVVFTETSSTPGPSNSAYILESDEFTLNSNENVTVDFWYHMYGLDTCFDYCYVQIDDGSGGWDTLWSLESVSHTGYGSSDPWDHAIAYSEDGANHPYTGTHKIRFYVFILTTYQGDFCLDAVWLNVTTTGPNTVPEITMDSPNNESTQDSSPVTLQVTVNNDVGEDMYVNWYGDGEYLFQNITNGNETVIRDWDCGSGLHTWNVSVNTTGDTNSSDIRWFALIISKNLLIISYLFQIIPI